MTETIRVPSGMSPEEVQSKLYFINWLYLRISILKFLKLNKVAVMHFLFLIS